MANEFDKSIKKAFSLARDMDLISHTCQLESIQASDNFKNISRTAKSYFDIYNAAIKFSEYNFIFHDGAFFQFTEDKPDEEIRLVFYPNPYKYSDENGYISEVKSLSEEQALTEEELEQYLAEIDFSADIPMIRYDLSFKQYCDKYHPAAHFHIGFFSNNRWPVKRKLTPYVFIMKILRNYYIDVWKKYEIKLKLDEKLCLEKYKCNILDSLYFTNEEEKRLYFT